MTATALAPETQPAEYLQLWSDSFSQVLGQITGSALASAVRSDVSAELPSAAESDLWAMVASSGGLRGEMALRLSAATALRLAQAFMSEPAAPEVELTAEHREAVIELLRQISGFVSTSAKARWGEIQLRVELTPAAPSWPAAATLWLQAGDAGPAALMIEFACSAALVAELRSGKAEAAKADSAKNEPVEVPAAASATVTREDSGQATGALDLLMDVELAMTMRFGARQMLLREVLELTPGAVVELDRRVQEPVDLLLDGKLVARGEVVVIDGSYGLRVTDVTALGPPRTP